MVAVVDRPATRPADHHGRDLFDVAVEQFNRAADVVGLEDSMRRILSVCQREVTVSFPVEMDDGSVQVFTGHRVQHNTGPGPTKGGIRFHQDVTLQEVKAIVDEVPASLRRSLSRDDADRLVVRLLSLGARAEARRSVQGI